MKPVFLLVAILIFGLLIAVHELGHFVVAKLCGVRVNEFAIGMGPLLFQRQRGETLYSLRLLPLGGFCAMEGEDEDTGDERAFVRQSGWKKFAILAAGPFMNFVFGVLIIAALFIGAKGFNVDRVAGLAPEFEYTGENGLMEGDLFYKVNGYRTYLAGDTQTYLAFAGDTVDIEVVRDGRHILVEDVARKTCTGTDGKTYQGFGVFLGYQTVPAGFVTTLRFIWYQALDFVQLVWFSLAQLFGGGVGMQDLSGPVGIVSTMTEVGEATQEAAGIGAALSNLAYFGAMIAVNLAVMNLLPIPALDGGRIFFLAVDAICLLLFRRKIPEKYQGWVNTAGFALLMGLMLLITFQDVFKLFR
ncbi:MAG: site-2 protease family protein [Ruminococcaceae bacterium]|nr:site-2 protease family protein [Oscillospiraceae bacterium]